MYSNCLIFALKKYFKHGGYLVIRRSRRGSIFPHFIWVRDLKDAELEHYVPLDDDWSKTCPPPLFRGKIKKDDIG